MTVEQSPATFASSSLDKFLSPAIRNWIEQTYYARINRQAELRHALADPAFLARPNEHVALFADHGVVHVRDVAQQILHVLDAAHGVLMPERTPQRFRWMQGLGVALAYVHDIGMAETGIRGRPMHAEYATQAALGPEFNPVIEQLRADDRGGIATRTGAFEETLIRELLAMAICHSKSKVPVDLLNDPRRLRATLQLAATTDLEALYHLQRQQRLQGSSDHHAAAPPDPIWSAAAAPSQISEALARRYGDFATMGFLWLEPTDSAGREWLDDTIDTLRALRCADALRQRGTALKTSGNYEIFIDRSSASAIFAMRPDAQRQFLLEVPDPVSAGEANLSSSELDSAGNLRIGFHHGKFRDAETTRYAARCAAHVVNDIHADTLGSFARSPGQGDPALEARLAEARILLESTPDNPDFVHLVEEALRALNPDAARRMRPVQSAVGADAPRANSRQFRTRPLDLHMNQRQTLLETLARFGHRTDSIDPVAAFEDAGQITLEAGDVLVGAGEPSDFVYIPLEPGLFGQPIGGYQPFPVAAWTPVGVTGVVRGAARNSTITARTRVSLIAIPKDAYLAFWHRTYDIPAFRAVFARYSEQELQVIDGNLGLEGQTVPFAHP